MSNIIRIFEPIGSGKGEYSHRMFSEELAAFGDEPVTVEINSEGGSIIEGFAIYDALRNHPGEVTTRVLGGAFSIASIIALGGDEREVSENSWMMIHNGMTAADGTSKEIRQTADLLDKFNDRMINTYAEALDETPEAVAELLDAETWFNADEAVELGLATSKIQSVKLAAKLDTSKYRNTPAALAEKTVTKRGKRRTTLLETEMATSKAIEPTPKAATIKELKAAFPKAQASFFVAMMEEEKTVEEATAEYMVETDEQMAAMTEELAKARAECDELKAKIAMMEEEDKPAMASAAHIVRPVAGVRTGQPRKSAQAQWDEKVNGFVAQGMPRFKAVARAARIPGLREALVAEANS